MLNEIFNLTFTRLKKKDITPFFFPRFACFERKVFKFLINTIREVVDARSLEMFKAGLDGALNSLSRY